MTALRVVIVSRAVHRALGVALVLAALSLAFGNLAISLDFSPHTDPPRRIPYAELFGVVAAVFATALLRPRFWEWDRIGGVRVRVVAASMVPVALIAAALPVFAVTFRLPPEMPWSWLLANVLTMAGIVVSLAALLGPALGGSVSLLLHVGMAVVDNLSFHGADWLPVTSFADARPEWGATCVAVLVALVVYAATRGLTGWAHRLGRNEQ